MYKDFVWCYLFILTLLNISQNTRLTAQGKSHGVTIHDSLIEGITFQEWSKESPGGAEDAGAGEGGAGPLRLSPPALVFGRAALAAAHARTVTVTNAANTTLHLASVAGTTPDFHASFFDSKTLPPGGNTSFRVVYLGRRAGAAAAHLYIRSSLGVTRYRVAAAGAPSPWRLWPLLAVRVPADAAVEPDLTLHNPTDRPVQVLEVYSSAAWLGLRLPAGEPSAPRDLWALPPGATRALVRLRLQPPRAAHPLTAYVRVRLAAGADGSGGGGGEPPAPLVVAVEARQVPAGEHARPLQLRLGTRGAADPPCTFDIELGNSLGAPVEVQAGVWGARCAALPPAPPAPPAPDDPPPPPPPHPHPHPHPHPPSANGAANGGGGGGGGGLWAAAARGASVSLVSGGGVLAPHSEPRRAAALTLDYGELWAGAGGAAAAGGEAHCAGWVRVGRAALPYSVRLLPGTLRLLPDALHFVTADREQALKERELRVRNEFPVPLRVLRVEAPPDLHARFHVWSMAGAVLAPGEEAAAARLRLRGGEAGAGAGAGGGALRAALTVHTNVTEYSAPVHLYSGELDIEWEWPAWRWSRAHVSLGAGGGAARAARAVRARLRNPAPARLCGLRVGAALPRASFTLDRCERLPHAAPLDHPCRCVEGGAWAGATLRVRGAARRGGRARGAVWARSPHKLSLRRADHDALGAALWAPSLPLQLAAPYAASSVPVVLAGGAAGRVRVRNASQPHRAGAAPDPALLYVAASAGAGAGAGWVQYAPERSCEPRCYTGLQLHEPEGAAWLQRCERGAGALAEDAALQRARRALHSAAAAAGDRNFTLLLHSDTVVQLPVQGRVRLAWPRLWAGAGAAAGCEQALAAVGGAGVLAVRARNPSRSHALLLHALLAAAPPAPDTEAAAQLAAACGGARCAGGGDAFRLGEWRGARGRVRAWPGGGAGAGGPLLLLEPAAEVELRVHFAPNDSLAFGTHLYLRNNLTVLESVPLVGRGVLPSFEIAGRRPGSPEPLLFEVSECGPGGGAATVRRRVSVRNTGRVPLRLREWRVAERACQARGFRLEPCAPLALAPNETRALTLAFTADFTLARVRAVLRARTDLGPVDVPLEGAAPARLLPACAARAPRPPWEPALRRAGLALALLAAAAVLAAAALDAERLLRRARAARAPAAPPPLARPLDLNHAAAAPPPPQPAPHPAPPASPPPARAPPLARRRKPTRRAPAPPPPPDPLAERRAFERWRAEVLRRETDAPPDDDDERSSEDADAPPADPPDADEDDEAAADPENPADSFSPGADDPPPADEDDAEPESEDRPRTSGEEDAASTGTESSRSEERDDSEERDEPESEGPAPPDEPPARAPPAPPSPPPPALRPAPPPPDAGLRARARARRGGGEGGEVPRRPGRAASRDPGEAGAVGAAVGTTTPRARPPGAGKPPARKERSLKRRSERAPPTPARSPPAPGPAGAAGGAGLRWGATWSSVVAARSGTLNEPLAPIGSSVRRRGAAPEAEPRAPPAADNSLFYFNGDSYGEPAWQYAAPPPQHPHPHPHPPQHPHPHPHPSAHPHPPADFVHRVSSVAEEPPAATGAYGSIGSLWSGGGGGGGGGGGAGERAPPAAAAAAWLWGGGGGGGAAGGVEVRPPPGFTAPPPFSAPPPVLRTYDPFQSLSSIWAPGALDWRRRDEPGPGPAPRDDE